MTSPTKLSQVVEAAFNPTPGARLGIDQDNYEANGNIWIRCSSSSSSSSSNIIVNIVLKGLGLE